jgi:hypothetical protein
MTTIKPKRLWVQDTWKTRRSAGGSFFLLTQIPIFGISPPAAANLAMADRPAETGAPKDFLSVFKGKNDRLLTFF